MAEYIERETLKERIFRRVNNELIRSWLCRIIDELPPADVAPARHGRWECSKPCPVCGEDRFKGLDADIWADWEPPYCPNCGANMNGVLTDGF